jgi:serine/threonine protein kinase/tetratricopeptide (TPR) repeat protein
MVSGLPPEEHPGAPSVDRGASIGRYIVLGLVGRGAMGEVYAAYDPELDRKVAVKLLRADAEDPRIAAEARARLLREAQAMARLSHPNVITVHDVGGYRDQVFVAMEFVEGSTVAYWLHAAPRPWPEIVRVFVAAGRGLVAAHEAQMVHRDFKAENVMLGRDGQVRVMDFGLAREVAGRPLSAPPPPEALPPHRQLDSTRVLPTQRATPLGAAVGRGEAGGVRSGGALGAEAGEELRSLHGHLATDLTQTGWILGTPAYLAPEVFRGHPADARSDQFSFCVALYEALYGTHPFGGETFPELSDNVLRGQLRSPPETARVPGWVRRAVMRGLQNHPGARFPTMEALLARLDRNPHRRGWWYVAASAAVVSLLLGVSVAKRPPPRRATCVVPADRWNGVWEPSGGRRAAIGASMRSSGKMYAAASFAGLERLLDRYVESWSAMYRDACEATNVRGEQSNEVLDLRMSCLRDRWKEVRALSDVLVESQAVVATNAIAGAAALTPVDHCADIGALRAVLAPPADPSTRQRVEALRNRLVDVKALEDAGHYSRTMEAAAQVVVEARVVGYRPLVAESLNRLARLQLVTGHVADADANFEQAVWVAEASSDDELVAEVSSQEIYVSGYLQHDMPRARRWMNLAEAVLDRIGGHDQIRAWTLNNIGVVLDGFGQHEEAAASLFQALQIKERVLGKDHPDVSYTLGNLADILRALGRPLEALELANRGVEIIGRTSGWEHPDMVLQLVNRAEILNQLGRYEDARRDAERAAAIQERETGRDVSKLVAALEPLGDAELGLHAPARAARTLARALELAEENDVDAELPRLRFALARALWDSGHDRARALQLARLTATADHHSPADAQLRRRATAWLGARTGRPR